MATYSPSKITKDGNTYNFTDTTKIPLAGTNALAGSIVPDTDNAYNLGDSSHNYARVFAYVVYNGVNNKSLILSGGNGASNGANLVLYGTNRSDGFQGRFDLVAKGSTDYKLTGLPSGTLTWGSKNVAMQEDVIPRSGGAVMTGLELARTVNTSRFDIFGGRGPELGGRVAIFGASYTDSTYSGIIGLYPYKNASNKKNMYLYPSGTWTWNGTACQITSDQRLKQQIAEIDDKLLDAWEDVELSQFKYNDSVNEKGDKARLHTGYVVQQIDKACKEHDVDISAYGLYCHEEYPEETEEVEVEQADGTKVKETKVIREASEHYSLRYTEVYAVECMYLRRCIARLTARIEELEKGNKEEVK